MHARHLLPALLVAAGCGSKDDGGDSATDTDTTPTTIPPVTATGPDVSNGLVTVDCGAQDDNRQRWDCAITTTTEAPVTLSWALAESGEEHRTVTTDAGTEHRVTLWGLREKTDYAYTVTTEDGVLSGVIATRRHQLGATATVFGEATFDTLLTNLPCGPETTLAIVTTKGDFIWSQPAAEQLQPAIGGYHYSQADHTVLGFAGNTLFEWALDGTVLTRLERGTHFDRPLHHDVFKAPNGYIYVLNADRVAFENVSYVMDGVYVFDGETLLATWNLSDHLDPIGASGGGFQFWEHEFPGALDWSHGNSVTVEDDGTMWLSFRWISTAMRLDGDPHSPTFGQVDWTMVGAASSPVEGDIAMDPASPYQHDFIGQHHVNPTGDGRVALFDNRTANNARAVVLDVDEEAGLARVVESYEAGMGCFAQGAHYTLPSGNRLVTCATSGLIMEFAPGQPDPVWSMSLACDEVGYGTGQMTARGIPIELPPWD